MNNEEVPNGSGGLPSELAKLIERFIEYCSTKPWVLYGITVLLQVPAVLARWLIAYVAFAVTEVELLGSVSRTAWAAAIAPIVWSSLAFKFPGKGVVWCCRYIGAREPSELERKRFARAFKGLSLSEKLDIATVTVYVIDHPAFFSFSWGRAIVVSRPLVESDFLRAVLAHELCHVNFYDARVCQALSRLVIWGDPFRPSEKEQHQRVTGFVTLVIWAHRWLFRIAGGRWLLNFPPLKAAWAAYFRKCEIAADAFAARAGQGPALARYLKAHAQQLEQPNPRLVFNLREYEPVAHRIARLLPIAAGNPVLRDEEWRWRDYSHLFDAPAGEEGSVEEASEPTATDPSP